MDKEHLLTQSLSKALAGFSENMCICINKSWYRDTIVQFQHFYFLFFLQLITKIKSRKYENKAAKVFFELGWESERK